MTTIYAATPLPDAWREAAERSAARHPDRRRQLLLDALTSGVDFLTDPDTALGLYAWCSCLRGWDRDAPCVTFAPHPDPEDAERRPGMES